ncbi:MFS transporter [Candidatus Omnitrophota bacterium]
MSTNPKLARVSWALYDLANTIFSMNIISLYFVLWLTKDKGCPQIYHSLALSSSMILAAILMPFLGELSDRLKRKTPFLIGFTLGCVASTAMLGFLQRTILILIFFALANLCYQLAGVTYNSLLSQVSTAGKLGRTSGLGVSLGYFGTIIGLILIKPFLAWGGRQATLVPTAALFLIFAAPAFAFIKDPPYPHIPQSELRINLLFAKLKKSLSQIRQDQTLSRFLLAAFLCLNAVNTIVVYMGVYANSVMGFNDAQVFNFMIISTIFAIAGSRLFGFLVDRWQSRKTLQLVFKLWCLTIFFAAVAVTDWMFWIVGPSAGICLGGTWVSLRTMLVELVPEKKIGQMFGLFGMLQMLSFIFGTTAWGIITSWLFRGLEIARYRIAIGSVFIFMFSGYLVLRTLPLLNKRRLEN